MSSASQATSNYAPHFFPWVKVGNPPAKLERLPRYRFRPICAAYKPESTYPPSSESGAASVDRNHTREGLIGRLKTFGMEEEQNGNCPFAPAAPEQSVKHRTEKKAKLTPGNGQKRYSRNDVGTLSQTHEITNRERNNRSRNQNNNPDFQLSKSLSWVLRHTAPSLGLHPTPDGYVPVEELLSLNHPRFQNVPKTSAHNNASCLGNRRKYTVEDVMRVVENSEKQRFRLEYIDFSCKKLDSQQDGGNEDSTAGLSNTYTSSATTQKDNLLLCIRANQGHSYKNIIDSDKLLITLTEEELSSPDLTIVHGTTRKAWEDHIRIEGLSRMKRTHIHFASGLPENPEASGDNTKQSCEEKKKAAPISGMRSTSQIYIYVNGRMCAMDGIKFYRSDNGVILTAGTNGQGLLPVKYFKKVVLASSGKVLYDDTD